MKTEETIKNELKEWIVKNNPNISIKDIADDTPLMDERIITSLQLVELIVLLEEMRNKTIEVEDLGAGVFKDLRTIVDTFFRPLENDR